MMVKFHETLSMNPVYSRYFYYMKLSTRTKHERLAQICSIDPEQEVVLVAITPSSYRLAKRWGENKIIAVGRLNRLKETNDAEIAVLVSDQYHALGLGNRDSKSSSAHRSPGKPRPCCCRDTSGQYYYEENQ